MEDPSRTTPLPGSSVEEWPGYVTHRTRGNTRNLVLIDRAKSEEKEDNAGRYRWLVMDTESGAGFAFSSRKKAEAALEVLVEGTPFSSSSSRDTRDNTIADEENISARLQSALESSFDCAEIMEWLRSLCTAEKFVPKSRGANGSTDYQPVPDTGPRERGLRLLLSYFVGRELRRDDTGGPKVRTVEEIEERLRTDEVYREAMRDLVIGERWPTAK